MIGFNDDTEHSSRPVQLQINGEVCTHFVEDPELNHNHQLHGPRNVVSTLSSHKPSICSKTRVYR